LVLDGSGAIVPDLRSHDWSPEGTQFVHDRINGQELRIADVLTGQSRQLIQANALRPVWSPDGANIAFNGPLTTIASIALDGSNFKTIIARGKNYTVGGPVWSPTGSHLVYWRFETQSFRQFVYRATADGGGNTNLTGELNYAIPYGWR
jgi:Tol biopolymer transport system component